MRSLAAFGAGKNPEAAGDPALDHLVLDHSVLDPGGRPGLFAPDDLHAAMATLAALDPTEGTLDFGEPDDRAADFRPVTDVRVFGGMGDRPAPVQSRFRQPDTDPVDGAVALDSSVRLTWSDRARALHRDGPPEPRVLPVREDLAPFFPWGGLRRGGTVAVRDSTALLLTLLAEATTSGSWAAVIGIPDLGVLAAAELGVAVDRLALVSEPGNDIVAVAAALLDGFDVVAIATPKITDAQARRLSARARGRGAALVAFGAWPGADLELRCTGARWSGLGEGHGHLRARLVEVHARGRGSAARPVRARLALQGTPFTPPRGPYPQLSKTG